MTNQLEELIRANLRSCVNCDHFCTGTRVVITEDTTVEAPFEYCALDPEKRRPPARIIFNGCKAFSRDLPF